MINDLMISSPRLRTVIETVEKGDLKALDELLEEVTLQGGPLMEPTTDENTTLVTFLWKGSGDTKNVLVLFFTAPTEGEFDNVMMKRIPKTDVWYRSYELPSQLRTTYLYSVNDSLVPFTSYVDVMTRLHSYTTDPFNPKTYTLISNPNEFKVSVLELPKAPRQPWNIRRKGVPRGQTMIFELHSEILDTDHQVSIYQPPDYSTDGEPYHVLLLFDGWSYYNFASITTVLDNLQYVKRIPPYVLIMHTNQDQDIRATELTCNKRFLQFLLKELMPWVQERYHITSDPEKTVIAGSCFGGIAASFAALYAPERFGCVISQSGSYWWPGKVEGMEEDWLIERYKEHPKLPIKFALNIGCLETGSLDYDPMTAHRRFRDVLLAKGYTVDYEEYIGGHDMICWRGSIVNQLLSFHPKEREIKREEILYV